MPSNQEIFDMWKSVVQLARKNLSPAQLEESKKHFESYRLTGYEHKGAWRNKKGSR